MKINDIVKEGMLDDLRAIGRAEQEKLFSKLSRGVQSMNPFASSGQPSRFAAQAKQSNIQTLATKYANAWEDYWKRFSAGKGPMELDAYQDALSQWLETTMRVRVDRAEVTNFVKEMDVEHVQNYLAAHFIPKYLEGMMDPQTQLNPGEKLQVRSQVGNISRDVSYTWNGKNWVDDATNRAVPAYSSLHNQLTQAALGEA